MLKKYIITALALSISFVGCSKTEYTDRNQLIIISESQEIELGDAEAKKILKSAKISTDIKATNIVKEIGQKIAQASGKDYDWEFHLIDEDVLNAFCLPGGKVFVYTGIFKAAKTKSQLATVMSHEIAHAIARHGAERLSMAQVNNFGKNLLSNALNIENPLYKDAFERVYGISSNLTMILPHSRKNESEADYIGLILMKKAGYNPDEAVEFWKNMSAIKNAGEPLPFLSTHPSDSKRIEDIQKALEKI